AMADPNDADGDGISGVPNWSNIPGYLSVRKNHVERNGKYIGRFGKKAAAYDLLHQTVNAYNQDIGTASSYEAHDTYTGLSIDPEISDNTINNVVFYLKTLKAPLQRNPDNADIVAGKKLFIQINCIGCHKPDLQTGYSAINVLSGKTIHPYTDL